MFEDILVPLDGSSLAECVLPHVGAMAKTFGARSTLLRVLERLDADQGEGSVDPVEWHISEAQAMAYLEEVKERLVGLDLEVNATTIGGAAAEKIVDFGHEANVDLIILSSHGRSGLSGWNVSSVVQKIILRSFVSLMIVRAYQPVPEKLGELVYRRILVPLDGSQRAECVLSTAVSLARDHGAQLFLVHVVRRPEMPRRTALTKDDEELAEKVVRRNHQEAELYLEDLSDRLAVRNSVHVLLDNDPAMALQQFAKDSETDLVILSAHGYTGKRRWPYGSVAASFIAYGTTPLLTIQDIPKEEAEPTWAEALAQEQKGH